MTKQAKRNGPLKRGWDLSALFTGDDDGRIEKNKEAVQKAAAAFIRRWKGRTDYLRDPAVLRKALDDYERWRRSHGTDGDAGYYFWLRTQTDRNDPELKARYNKIDEFGKRIENETQFFSLRLARIPSSRQRRFMKSPVLARYRHFLERVFAESPYLLSEKEERIMNLKSTTSYANWVRLTSDFLAREEVRVFQEDKTWKVKTLPEVMSLMNSKQKRVRDVAARAFNTVLERHADVAEAEINAVLMNKKVDDELRGVPRPDLTRHVADDISSETVDAVLAAVSLRFSISAEYYKLKASLMGVKRLRYHERNVEYGNLDGRYPFDASLRLVRKVLGELDSRFLGIVEEFLASRQIDVYPRKGKGGGAFCAHHLPSQPTYIMLNHTDRLHDVLTLAHELGHGINNELVRESNHALDFGTPISTAEVASTFMEDFVLREILKDSDEETRLSIMMMKLNDEVSTIFRQVACYRFEQELHSEFRKKGYLSKQEIGLLFQRHMGSYMGESVEQSPGSENWWIYWSHIRAFFYVYSYASGLLISKSLQRSVREDPRSILKVKQFLSAGLSDSPQRIFKGLGIDIADRMFWDQGLDEVEELLKETRALAKKLGRLP